MAKMRFKSSVALVTGGASGIGLATAKALAVEGAAIAVVDLDARLGRAAVASLRELGIQAELFTTDVADPAAVDAAVTAAAGHFGRLDVLINSAGIVGRGGFEQTGVEEWRKIIEIDLSSVFYTTRAVLPVFKQVGSGSIVNIASVAAHRGGGVNVAYSAAKGGLLALTRQLADDLAPYRVRVNSVSPGFTATPANAELRQQGAVARWQGRIPWGRYGEPGEVAAACLFLASADADYITGTDLIVDGGMSAVIRPEAAAGV